MLKRFVFLVLLVITSNFLHAQIMSARVGVNGLTCSQCSRSVEMQLRKLSFVKNVNMNLKQTEGGLEFKEGAKIDFSKIAQAVRDAGFSVRFLTAQIDMAKVQMDDKGFRIANESFLMLPNASVANDSKITVRFLGKTYSSQKDVAYSAKATYKVELVSEQKTLKSAGF